MYVRTDWKSSTNGSIMKNNQQQGVRTRHVLGCARLLGDDGAAVARRPHHLLGGRLLLLRRRRDGLPLLSPAASSSLSTAAAAGSSFSLRSMVSAKPLLPEALLPSPSPPPGRQAEPELGRLIPQARRHYC
jgi:hypothetical protein